MEINPLNNFSYGQLMTALQVNEVLTKNDMSWETVKATTKHIRQVSMKPCKPCQKKKPLEEIKNDD